MSEATAPARARPRSARLRLAVFGVLAEGAGSSAGAYPRLMARLLARGHEVEFFGNPGYVRPRSLEGVAGYRFHPLHVAAMERLWERFSSSSLPRALVAQLGILAYQREAIRCIERVHASAPFDAVLCTDIQPLWPTRLPLIAWPQGPPHTEASALRSRELAREVVRARGAGHFAAVQAFYAYRALVGRIAAGFTDLYLCGSEWAAHEWRRFGAASDHVAPFPYPIELADYAGIPALRPRETVTFLWLGRSVPRKRLDLFVAGFAQLTRRHPRARARIVGNVATDPFGRDALERFTGLPGLTVEPPLPREQVPELFGAIDVLVQPSQNENFGFSIAEALASGRPVVGGPTNGTLDYAGQAAFRFDEYTPAAVALAMERALQAVTTEPVELSRRARDAARVFDLDAVTDRFTELCEALLTRKNARESARAAPVANGGVG